MAVEKDITLHLYLPPTMQDRSPWSACFCFAGHFFFAKFQGGRAGRTANKGEEGQKEVVCHSPAFQGMWHWQSQLLGATLKTKMMNLLLARGR